MKKVMIFGTFDILHAGHISLFEQARACGDYLVAVVARDTTVAKIKKQKPYHSERERQHLLQHIDLIDDVVLGDKKDPTTIIRKLKPDVIALGYDQKAFVDTLKELPFTVSVIRLKASKPSKYKSHKIKAHLAQMI